MSRRLLFLACLVVALLPRIGVADGVTGGFGVMGDSGSDEYRADDNRGGAYAQTTLNWVELLVRYRSVNAGPWGTRAFPRRMGYEYNWARSGATTADVVSEGQAAGLAQQVAEGKVSRALLMVGANDFSRFNGTFDQIYDGTLSGAALTAKIDGIVANIRVALDTVRLAGPVQLFVATLGDRTSAPPYPAMFPDPAKRQRVSDAILAVNNGIRTVATQRGISIIDIDALASTILPKIDANGNLFVGGEAISFSIGGDEPHHVLLGDYEHGGTVFEGVLANHLIAQFVTTGWGIAPFTDEELLHNAGIFPVVPDTTFPEVSITTPANGAVVSGSITVSASASDNVGVLGVRFLADGITVGTEDTTAPYSRSWNATNVAPGAHVLTVEARDAANNVATASATVTVVDTTLPTVTVTAPPNGGQVTGALTVRASASDNIGVAGVTFYWGSTALGPEDTQAPYEVTVQTTSAQNGTVSLTAVARDTSGNTRTSSPVLTTINNPVPDTTPPLVSMTGPVGTVSNTVTISANATDNVNVVGVQFKLNGSSLGAEDTVAPDSVAWNTTSSPNGAYVVSATARDAAGNATTSSATVNVLNVLNVQPETRYPSAYTITGGSYQSGNVQSLLADDNNYLSTQSGGSWIQRTSQTDLEFSTIALPVSRLDILIALASTTSSTTLRVFVYNVVTASWSELNASTIGTSETTKTLAISASAANYVSPSGSVKVRVQSSKILAAHSIRIDLARMTVTH